MSEISKNINQQNGIPTCSLSVDEDVLFENCNSLPLNHSKRIQSKKDIDNIKCSNTFKNNNLKMLKTINTTSMVNYSNDNCDNKLIKSNNSYEPSQANSKYFIDICGLINAHINSQEKKIILNMVQKNMKHVLISNAELTIMDTQQFIDLNVHKAIHRLQGSQQHEDVSKNNSIELMESDDSVFYTPPLMQSRPDELIKSKHDYKDVITVSDSKKSEEFNNTFSKTDVKSTKQMDDKVLKQDEDSEIINFQAMCEAMAKVGVMEQVNLNSNPLTMVKNQMKNIDLKKITEDILIVNDDDVECVPMISNKLISSVDSSGSNHTSDISKRKRHYCNSPTLNLFSDSSPKYFNEQKQFNHQNKKFKLTSSQNFLKIQSKSCSKKIKNPSDKNAMNCIFSSSENEEDCMLIKNQSSKVNTTKKSYKCKRIYSNSSKQNKLSIEKEEIFYCSPVGRIHKDMMNYIKPKNNIMR